MRALSKAVLLCLFGASLKVDGCTVFERLAGLWRRSPLDRQAILDDRFNHGQLPDATRTRKVAVTEPSVTAFTNHGVVIRAFPKDGSPPLLIPASDFLFSLRVGGIARGLENIRGKGPFEAIQVFSHNNFQTLGAPFSYSDLPLGLRQAMLMTKALIEGYPELDDTDLQFIFTVHDGNIHRKPSDGLIALEVVLPGSLSWKRGDYSPGKAFQKQHDLSLTDIPVRVRFKNSELNARIYQKRPLFGKPYWVLDNKTGDLPMYLYSQTKFPWGYLAPTKAVGALDKFRATILKALGMKGKIKLEIPLPKEESDAVQNLWEKLKEGQVSIYDAFSGGNREVDLANLTLYITLEANGSITPIVSEVSTVIDPNSSRETDLLDLRFESIPSH